jgi:hypothetical protein
MRLVVKRSWSRQVCAQAITRSTLLGRLAKYQREPDDASDRDALTREPLVRGLPSTARAIMNTSRK